MYEGHMVYARINPPPRRSSLLLLLLLPTRQRKYAHNERKERREERGENSPCISWKTLSLTYRRAKAKLNLRVRSRASVASYTAVCYMHTASLWYCRYTLVCIGVRIAPHYRGRTKNIGDNAPLSRRSAAPAAATSQTQWALISDGIACFRAATRSRRQLSDSEFNTTYLQLIFLRAMHFCRRVVTSYPEERGARERKAFTRPPYLRRARTFLDGAPYRARKMRRDLIYK